MEVAVVYESIFGNTRLVAETIAEGLRSADAGVQVALLPVANATDDKVGEVDLLVVGGPTHMMGLTSVHSRKSGAGAGNRGPSDGEAAPHFGEGAVGLGLREWLEALPAGLGERRAAAFDTRLSYPLAGGAARTIARRLGHRGYELVAKPTGFVVQGAQGPLKPGERERALAWGAALTHDQMR